MQSVARVPIQIENCKIYNVGLECGDDLSLGEWLIIGNKLRIVESCHRFLLGDWLNYGEKKYGEDYKKATDLTGYDIGSLYNIAWACSQVEISRRRESLSFGHHQEVAPLAPDIQSYWLTKAEAEKWSVMDLRQAIRTSKPRQQLHDAGTKTKTFAGLVTQMQRWIKDIQEDKDYPIDMWAPVERANTKEQISMAIQSLSELCERL